MRIEHITWIDAGSPEDPWLSQEEVVSYAERDVVVDSVGQLIHENDRYVVLGVDQCKERDSTTWGSLTKIPKAWIQTRRTVEDSSTPSTNN